MACRLLLLSPFQYETHQSISSAAYVERALHGGVRIVLAGCAIKAQFGHFGWLHWQRVPPIHYALSCYVGNPPKAVSYLPAELRRIPLELSLALISDLEGLTAHPLPETVTNLWPLTRKIEDLCSLRIAGRCIGGSVALLALLAKQRSSQSVRSSQNKEGEGENGNWVSIILLYLAQSLP